MTAKPSGEAGAAPASGGSAPQSNLFTADAELGYHSCAIADVPAILAGLSGADSFNAWLEDPLAKVDPIGLRLRAGVARTEALELLARWPEGRLFNAAVDLRWEQRPKGRVHLVAIADTLPGLFRIPPPLPLTLRSRAQQECLFLWGRRPNAVGEDVWEEARIPNLMQIYDQGWKGNLAAILTRTYESPWEYDPDMPPAVRVVTRYLGYDGNIPLDTR